MWSLHSNYLSFQIYEESISHNDNTFCVKWYMVFMETFKQQHTCFASGAPDGAELGISKLPQEFLMWDFQLLA